MQKECLRRSAGFGAPCGWARRFEQALGDLTFEVVQRRGHGTTCLVMIAQRDRYRRANGQIVRIDQYADAGADVLLRKLAEVTAGHLDIAVNRLAELVGGTGGAVLNRLVLEVVRAGRAGQPGWSANPHSR